MTATTAPRVRSALFVPASRQEYLAKADQRGADAVILDLEDSVADGARSEAAELAGAWIAGRADPLDPVVLVRVNAVSLGRLADDLAAVVHSNLTGILVPKTSGADDVRTVDGHLSYAEGCNGVAHGTVRIWPLLESAAAVLRSSEIAAASSRVAYLGGGAANGGDLARSVGFRWTPGAEETRALRAQVLLAARAAGVPNPMTGTVTSIDGLDEVRGFAQQSRALGYEGMMVIHPSHVAVANEVFSATDDELREAEEIVAALASAADAGSAAVRYRGRMIDAAMAETARRLLDEQRRRRPGP